MIPKYVGFEGLNFGFNYDFVANYVSWLALTSLFVSLPSCLIPTRVSISKLPAFSIQFNSAFVDDGGLLWPCLLENLKLRNPIFHIDVAPLS